jgi:cytoskeletal protein RodZ
MPAEQHFDQKHLQAVALAQSGQIRPARSFSHVEKVTRPLVWLILIVAVVAIGLGIRDYVGGRKAANPASTATPTVEPSKGGMRAKRSTSSPSKTKAGRSYASEAGLPTEAQAAADGSDTPLVSRDSSQSGTELVAVTDTDLNSPAAGTASDEVDAAGHGHGGIRSDRKPADPALSACLPLPNGVQPGDVDAAYYFGWASEYCGRDLASSHPAVRSHKPKK